MPPALRSVMSVMTGFLALSLVSIMGDAIYHLATRSTSITSRYLVWRVVINLIAAAIGGFVCALVAGRRPFLHAGVFAAILLSFSVASMTHAMGHYPGWYIYSLTFGPALAIFAGAACDFPELRRAR